VAGGADFGEDVAEVLWAGFGTERSDVQTGSDQFVEISP
jgi:hypothetical protein